LARIQRALEAREAVCVYGDYDVDALHTALSMSCAPARVCAGRRRAAASSLRPKPDGRRIRLTVAR